MSQPIPIRYCPNCTCDLRGYRILHNSPGAGKPKLVIPPEAKAEYESGTKTLIQLATRYGCSVCTMQKWMKSQNAKKPKKFALIPDSIADEYRAGATVLMLSHAHKAPPIHITKRLIELGVEIRPAGGGYAKDKSDRYKDMVKRAAAGESFVSIGKSYGISRERARHIVITHGGQAYRKRKMAERKAREQEEETKALALAKERAKALEALAKEYAAGDTYEKIAQRRGCTSRNIAVKIQRLRKYHPDLFPFRNDHSLDQRPLV